MCKMLCRSYEKRRRRLKMAKTVIIPNVRIGREKRGDVYIWMFRHKHLRDKMVALKNIKHKPMEIVYSPETPGYPIFDFNHTFRSQSTKTRYLFSKCSSVLRENQNRILNEMYMNNVSGTIYVKPIENLESEGFTLKKKYRPKNILGEKRNISVMKEAKSLTFSCANLKITIEFE